MEEQTNGIRILVINSNDTETESIRGWLSTDMSVPWNMMHCTSVEKAKNYLPRADIIVLRPEMEGQTRMEVFQDLNDMINETPIIVLASAIEQKARNGKDRGLSKFMIENDAPKGITRGQFARLADAVEFAMIRQKKAFAYKKIAD